MTIGDLKIGQKCIITTTADWSWGPGIVFEAQLMSNNNGPYMKVTKEINGKVRAKEFFSSNYTTVSLVCRFSVT